MLPFLLLSIRAEPAAVVDEHAAFLRFTGLAEAQLRRVRLQEESIGSIRLRDYSGILLGGGPYSVSEPEKDATQVRVERELAALLDEVIAADFPFLGACYGIGTLGARIGAVIDRAHPEGVGPLSVRLTESGVADPLFAGLPRDFSAYGGHKEGASWLPSSATLLATSEACPVQAFRVGTRVYATQFHPELDLAGLETRIDTYASFGYFPPDQAGSIKAHSRQVPVSEPMRLLPRFVELFARDV